MELSDAKHCAQVLKHAHCTDKTLLCVTFVITVAIDLTVAVLVGVALAWVFMQFSSD